ncbi:MAG: hypothetical protein HY554_14100 [Elusimicrobia bacterium]|nr:hypothetical protein [Elusimicrobiota bacterium]
MNPGRLRRAFGGAARAGLALFLAASAASGAERPDVRRLPGATFESGVRLVGRTWRFDEYEVRFPSPAGGRFRSNDLVWGTLYLPRRPRPDAVLLLPVMAAPNLWIERRFAYLLVMEGFAVLQLDMPFQFRRAPPGARTGEVFLARRPETLARNFSQAVLDARRAVTWLRGSGLVEPERIALLGASLGALVGSVTLSVDDRLAAGALLLGGADFPSLIANGEMTSRFVRQTGLDVRGLGPALKGLDPLEYREANRGKRVLLVNVRNDLVIPLENALKLRDAFPGCRQLLLPLGHYTAMLHLLWMPSYVAWQMRGLLTKQGAGPTLLGTGGDAGR